MTDDDMSSSMHRFRSLVPQLGSALKDFQSSSSNFRVLKTIHPSDLTPQDPQPPSQAESPKTLFILDSSFNPPSIAHETLAASALHKSSNSKFPTPHRLLLLFATMNADKAPSAATFDQRLTLMTIFAVDLLRHLKSSSDEHSVVPIDIGVTTVPYYTDKSAAIASEGSTWYPDQPTHIHLIGFDTLTRFFGAKYYPNHSPPFSALTPYFSAGHRLRVTLRPDDAYGTLSQQKSFIERLERGEMEPDGGKREWARQIEVVEPNERVGVSSTRVRKAAKRGDWEEVRGLCTEGVGEWVRGEGLYEEDDRGAKMA